MTPADFAAAVASELKLRSAAFDRRELKAFVASTWPLMEDDPDVIRWAYEFINAEEATTPA
jgi:hypothetical protein